MDGEPAREPRHVRAALTFSACWSLTWLAADASDQPVACVWDDQTQALAFYATLTAFYDAWPTYNTHELKIIGESYAGMLHLTPIPSHLISSHAHLISSQPPSHDPTTPHPLSQATFASYYIDGLDMVIPIDQPASSLAALAARVGRTDRSANCSLTHENAARDKPSNVPSADALSTALTSSLLVRLCELYVQDYVCFGLQWPAACAARLAPHAGGPTARLTAMSVASASPSAAAGASHHLLPVPLMRTSPAQQLAPPPRVSVAVLTACNRQAFLALTLQQIARQTYPLTMLEVIVVADGLSAADAARLADDLRALDAVHSLHTLAAPDTFDQPRRSVDNSDDMFETGAQARSGGDTRESIELNGHHASSGAVASSGTQSGDAAAHSREHALAVRFVHLRERSSIGTKRNVALRVARGDVVMHCARAATNYARSGAHNATVV
jgi:hypothetical protein